MFSKHNHSMNHIKNLSGSLHRIPETPQHTTMAKAASKCLFLFLLSLFSTCSSGTLVGFSCHTSGNTTTSPGRTISFLKQNKIAPSQIRVFVEDPRILRTLSNTGVAVDLYLNEGHVNSKSFSISGLKTHIIPFLSQVELKSIIVTSGNDYTRKSTLPMLLATLKSIHSVLTSLPAEHGIKVSVAFPLSFLQNLRTSHGRDLHRICDYIIEVRSSVIVEATISGELSMGDRFVKSMIERVSLANSLLPCTNVPLVLTIKSPAVPSATEVAQFADKVSKALENNTHITSSIVELYAEVSSMEDFAHREMEREEEQIFPSSRRELHLKTTLHDETLDSPTIFPTTPITTTPISTTPYYPTPTVVTVPSTNPVSIAPVNPSPSTTPITVPSTNPAFSPVPEANPTTAPPVIVPGSTQPITNPVTTYPAPTGTVPVVTPVTNPVPAPATTTNAPAVPGQSWCVAKTGASATAVQAGLDYACGKVDCSLLQQGGSCYNPNSLQNHASYAFNSYYQKNPVPTSCDFAGVATIVSTNPSTGSCTYLSSSSSSSTTPTPTTPAPVSTTAPPVSTTPTPVSTTPTPVSTTPTPETTTPSPETTTPTPAITSFPPPGEGVSGSGTPPSVLNSSNPAASGSMPEFGIDGPPGFNSSTSASASLRPFVSYIFLVTALVTRNIALNM